MSEKKVVYKKPKYYRIEYSYVGSKEYSSIDSQLKLKSFDTLEECFEFISSHKRKNDMKFIKIFAEYHPEKYKKGYMTSHFEYVTFFLYNSNFEENINGGQSELSNLVPKKK